MKITNIGAQVRNPDRVNISIDGAYRFSLLLSQVVDYGLKIGLEIDEATVLKLETASTFGKLYQRALEYSLVRPRSEREMRDYLYRKTLSKPVRNQKTGEVRMREGVSGDVTQQVLKRLIDKGYVDDRSFAEFWVRNRFMKKGVSSRRLREELSVKGVDRGIVDEVLQDSERNDTDELQKVISKKRARYSDDTKFMQYLARQGFSYDEIKAALSTTDLIE